MHEATRYLKNRDGSRRRRSAPRCATTLEAAWSAGERVLLIGHSLGSVIAYDTLWELTHVQRSRGEISLLVTMGSPLATHFVQRSLQGVGEVGCAPLSAQRSPLGEYDGARGFDGVACRG